MQPRLTISPAGGGSLPIAALRLDRSLTWPVGVAEAELSALASPPAPGAAVTVEAATTGPVTKLLTGAVRLSEPGPRSIRLLIEEPTGALARLRIDQVHRSATAGKVIQGLANEAGVTPGTVEPGATLPAYAVTQDRTALDQILRLCTASGLLARTDTAGKLHAATPLPVPTVIITAPAAIIDWSVAQAPDVEPAKVTVSGDGAMGRKGPGAENWVVQDLSSMRAGSGGAALHLPELKAAADVAKAQQIAQMRLQEAAKTAKLTLADLPPADLGEVIAIAGYGALDGAWRITAIRVRWGVPNGFTCHLSLSAVA
ncbi:MAG: hypothetical protein K0R39_3392 [Symbiobacteriaceae bacterium]|jgi:hypothetical protein|nr:hypothetical protein [Symbiobacteriaceae bacterium]